MSLPQPPNVPTEPKALRRALRQLRERSEYLESTGESLLRKRGRLLSPEVLQVLRDQLAALRQARAQTAGDAGQEEVARFDRTVAAFDDGLNVHLGQFRKSPTRELVEAIALALLLTLGIRAFVFEAFKIPTGSMIPTLQIHDHLFVNKFLYGLKIPFTRLKYLALRDPKPGEIVVFEYPYDDDPDSAGKDLIKRVIAVAGQRVRMVDNAIQIDGKPIGRKIVDQAGDCGQSSMGGAYRCKVVQECLGGFVYTAQHHVSAAPGLLDVDNSANWPPAEWNGLRYGPHAMRFSPPENREFPDFVVPDGHLLVMGDNRDNSKDGRFFGLVPLDTVKGKAGVRWWAFVDDWYRPELPRMFEFIHQDAPDGDCARWQAQK